MSELAPMKFYMIHIFRRVLTCSKIEPLLSISWTQFCQLIFSFIKILLVLRNIHSWHWGILNLYQKRPIYCMSKTLQTWWIKERLKPTFAVFSLNFWHYPFTTISHRSFVILLSVILLFSFCFFCYQPGRDLLICIFCRKMNIIFGYIWWCLSLVVY